MKKVTKTTAKNSAYRYFQLYLRKLWTKKGYVKCYTCGKKLSFKEVQVGHWFPGHNDVTYVNEDYVRPQCLTKESNLRLFNGKYKSIKDVRVSDLLWGFDEKTFVKRPSQVLAVKSFIPDELYEVELENGKKFYATGDHKVVSKNEWVEIKDILHTFSDCDILEL